MTNRVNSLSGHIEIDSRKGKGTTLTIEIPLLTRVEEIRLAKLIEDTRRDFRAKLLESDYVFQMAFKVLGRVHR